MIVDCHTHIWQSPDQLGRRDWTDPNKAARARSPREPMAERALWRYSPLADPAQYWSQNHVVDKSIVLGFKSRHMSVEIPNRFVAEYVSRFPQKLIGFAGIDPTDPGAVAELRAARTDLNLRGITLSPANQDFHPTDSRALAIYAEAEKQSMPILIHPVAQFNDDSKLEYARPYLLDEVARAFPKLRLIIAQLGYPWIEETICLLSKHPNVFADVSGLLTRPWQAYNALVNAHESQVMEKLLFGSDFPFTGVSDCIESLYSVNQMTLGTNLPVVPRESLRGIVERDTLGLLGIA
jgi:uncharacterized protein